MSKIVLELFDTTCNFFQTVFSHDYQGYCFMSVQHIGYKRVSTEEQKTDRQLEHLKLDKEFVEKASGKSTDRPVLNECLSYCREGDELHIHSIDRFARSLHDLESLIRSFNSKGVTVSFHSEKLSFSSDSDDPMATLTLQMLGAFAQFERTLIKKRQQEGFRVAKSRGVKLGRKPTLSEETISEIEVVYKERKESVTQMAKRLGVSRATIYNALKLNRKS